MAGSLLKPKYKEGTDYVLSEWGPDHNEEYHVNYECTRCMYATLDAGRFNEHLDGKNHSQWPWPKEAVMEDAEGKEIKVKGYHPQAAVNPFAKPVVEGKK